MSYLSAFHEGINSIITEFQRNPFNFLYEIDIQAFLFSSIYHNLRNEGIRLKGGYFPPIFYPDDSSITTVPVKCEYPVSQKFDVAIIDNERVEHYDPQKAKKHGWRSDPFWNQPVRAVVEIKYLQIGDAIGGRVAGFDKDVEKLTKYRKENSARAFLGMAFLFIQSENVLLNVYDGEHTVPDRDLPPTEGVFRYIVTPQRWLQTPISQLS